MEETSDSAITGQSILSKTQVCLLSARLKFACFLQEIVCEFFKNEIIEERLSAVVFLAGSLFFFFLFPSPISISPLSFVLSPLSFLLCPFSFVLCPLSFLLSPLSFVLSHFSFVLSHFSRLSHFVAQISANVNIYRIDSSFLHIICAFLA